VRWRGGRVLDSQPNISVWPTKIQRRVRRVIPLKPNCGFRRGSRSRSHTMQQSFRIARSDASNAADPLTGTDACDRSAFLDVLPPARHRLGHRISTPRRSVNRRARCYVDGGASSSLAEVAPCVAMMRSRPAIASAIPATIVLAVPSLIRGICGAASQIPAKARAGTDFGKADARVMRESQDDIHARRCSARRRPPDDLTCLILRRRPLVPGAGALPLPAGTAAITEDTCPTSASERTRARRGADRRLAPDPRISSTAPTSAGRRHAAAVVTERESDSFGGSRRGRIAASADRRSCARIRA
jgi:hypothetical protein